jgi:hypothetical protein
MTFDPMRLLRGELCRSLHGTAWHRPALCEALADVSVSEAFAWAAGSHNAPLGSGVPYAVMLSGVVQHNVYHAGQIVLLKKALRV